MRKQFVCHTLLWIVVALYLSPLWFHYPEEVLPSLYPDVLEFVWNSWHLSGVATGSKSLYFTGDLFYPDGSSLLLHTECEGILLPLALLLPGASPVWRLCIAVFLCMALNASAAFSLCRAIRLSPIVATVFALLLTFNPFAIGHLSAGHLNFLVLFPMIEILRALLRRVDDSQWTKGDFVRVLCATTFLPFVNLYYLYFAAMLHAVFALLYLATDRRRALRLIGWQTGSFILALGIVSPHLWDVAQLARSGSFTPDHDPTRHSADLLSYLLPSANRVIGTTSWWGDPSRGAILHAGETSLSFSYGLIVLLLLKLIDRRNRSWLSAVFLFLSALAFLFLSFGPEVNVGGYQFFATGYDSLLRRLLPLYPSVPARFGVITHLLIWCVACWSIRDLFQQKRTLLSLILIGISVLEALPTRVQAHLVPRGSPVLEGLATNPTIRAILDVPDSMQDAMLRQTVHGKAIIGGFLSRRPRRSDQRWKKNVFVRWVRGRASVDLALLRPAWCQLHADTLLISAHDLDLRARLLGVSIFSEVSSDTDLVVFQPLPELCNDS